MSHPHKPVLPPDTAQLATMVGSRLCHDLVSPVGAIANGLELLRMPGSGEPELDLITESSTGATTRLRFYRLAFGFADDRQQVRNDELSALLRAQYCGRLSVNWPCDGDLSRVMAQLGCLALMCLAQTMPRGGSIKVSAEAEHLRFDIEGEAKRDAILWAALEAGTVPPGLTPAQVEYALLPLLAREHGCIITPNVNGLVLTCS